MKGNHKPFTFSSSRRIFALNCLVIMFFILNVKIISLRFAIVTDDKADVTDNKADVIDNKVQSLYNVSVGVSSFWEDQTGVGPFIFKWIRSNPVLPSFTYGYPEKEADQQQVTSQQILEPYVSIRVAEHLQTCCDNSDDIGRGHFLDVGGNFGWYALLAAASGCDVDSFEPVDWFRHLLEANAKLNGFISSSEESQSMNIHPLIASDIPDIDLEIYIPLKENALMGTAGINGMNVDTNNDFIKLTKQTTTIDEFGVKPKHHSCAMKIDVEGFEPKVLAGGKNFIANYQPPMIIMELSPGMTRDGVPEMLNQLEESGYKPHLLDWRVIKSEDIKTWQNDLSLYSVEWNADQMIKRCGYNCMLLLVLDA